MNQADDQYYRLLTYVLAEGQPRSDRTGVGTISTFAPPAMKFDLQRTFPLITTKKIHFKSVVHELFWFVNGDTNVKYLQNNGVKIWDQWADADGNLGKIYGIQMRNFGGKVDQLQDTIQNIKKDPFSRRHVITLWNPLDLEDQALACCHGTVIQFYVQDDTLSCHMYQRSADVFLGVPFNIASYALLTHMMAQVTGYKPGYLHMSFGDAHVYSNHLDQVKEQLSRTSFPGPQIKLNDSITDITAFKYEDVTLEGYQSHGKIVASVAV